MRLRELAQRLAAEFEGDPQTEIDDVATLESAGPRQLAFAAGSKAVGQARKSPAGCLVVPLDFPAGRPLIRAAEPRALFARAVLLFHPPRGIRPGIHPSAIVARDATLGAGVEISANVTIGARSSIGAGASIGPGCAIGEDVSLGPGALLHAHVTIYDGVKIGARAVLHSGCVLGADGFGFVLAGGRYEKFPQIGGVEIGDDVEIGANSCVDRAALGVTSIGDGVKLDNMVHVGHNCRIGKHVVVAAQTGFSGGVVVEDYAVIGGQVGIGDKARIESRAVLGSGCGVLTSKIVRSGQIVWGTPARPLKEYLDMLAALSHLPELRAEVRDLQRRLAGEK